VNTAAATPAALPQPKYLYKARVVKIVDGDTLDLDVDLGLRVRTQIRARLFDVDAPEKWDPRGLALTQLLQAMLPPGSEVLVHTYKDPKDKFGRWLAKVSHSCFEGDMAAWLIANGHMKEA